VIDLRGRVIPVVSARAAFGLPDAGLPPDARIAVLDLGDARAGLIVDDVVEVMSVDAKLAVPAPERAGAASAEAIEAVVRLEDRLLVILDVEALLDPARRGLDLSYATDPPLDHEEDEVEKAGPEPGAQPEPEAQIEPEPEPEEPEETREAIDPEDVVAVRAVFAMLEPHQEEAVALFSGRLREVDPGLHVRMGLDDPARGRRFMAALRLSVRGLDRLEDLVPALRALGVRVDIGAVTPAECRTAIDAFLWTLQRGLGRRFDPESRQVCGATAWTLIGILSRAGGGA
jgi:hypothetical protein